MNTSAFEPENSTFRIHSIEMTNFRNIEHSIIVFPNSSLNDISEGMPSVLGLYGQNGSGKTSVIMALSLLKQLVSGRIAKPEVNRKYLSCIRNGCDRATLKYVFSICAFTNNMDKLTAAEQQALAALSDAAKYEVSYSVDIVYAHSQENEVDTFLDTIQFENEQLAIKVLTADGSVSVPRQVFIDTSESVCGGKLQAFGSKSKYRILTQGDSNLQNELFKEKIIAKSQSRSLIFSPTFFKLLYDKRTELKEQKLMDSFGGLFLAFLELSFVDQQEAFECSLLEIMKQFLLLETDIDDSERIDRIEKADQEEIAEEFVEYTYTLLDSIRKEFNLKTDIECIKDSDEPDLIEVFFNIASELESNTKANERIISNYLFYALSIVITSIHYKTFIVDTINMGIVNENKNLPVILRTEVGKSYVQRKTFGYRTMLLHMDGETLIKSKDFSRIADSVNRLSKVLSRIIPELSLEVKDCGTRYDEDEEKRGIVVFANRDGISIPLKYESDGIRRLVSILSPLIGVYNDPSVLLAVDEIDSGIFEYLLGEILQIFSTSGKGQLVFTSHNLRPLEVLPAKFLAFTTTNALNRYTSMAKRGNTNLRDAYFRNIVLGSKCNDDIYRSTDQYEIEEAFLIAGE